MAEPGQKGGSVRLVAFRARLWEAVASCGQSPDARPSARWRPQRPSSLMLGLCPAPRRCILPRPGLPSRIPPTHRRSPHLGLWGSVGCRREAAELPQPDSSFGSGLARGAAWANLRPGGCSRQLQEPGTPSRYRRGGAGTVAYPSWKCSSRENPRLLGRVVRCPCLRGETPLSSSLAQTQTPFVVALYGLLTPGFLVILRGNGRSSRTVSCSAASV